MAETSKVRQDRKKRPRLGGDIITVLVGPEATATRFFVHADLVSQHSDFFQACLKKGWKEAEERIVRLPDLPANSATAFEDFHSFLYTGKVYSGVEGDEDQRNRDKEWCHLGNCWILGEVLLSVSFKDVVVDAILEKIASTNRHPVKACVEIHHYGTCDRPIKRLMVEIVVQYWSEQLIQTEFSADSDTKASFYRSVSIALLKEKRQPAMALKAKNPITEEGSCFYHEHGDKPCYKAMF